MSAGFGAHLLQVLPGGLRNRRDGAGQQDHQDVQYGAKAVEPPPGAREEWRIWVDRLLVATSRKVNGRRLKWRDVMDNPHGLVLGPMEFGHFRDALRTDDKRVHTAPPEFLARTRELLAAPVPVAPERHPFQLGSRKHRHSMNS